MVSMEHLLTGTTLKTNMLCINRATDCPGGNYTNVLAALNHMFACSKGEYLFLLVDDTLFGGLVKDSVYTDNQFEHFFNVLKNPATNLSGTSLSIVSTGFQYNRTELLKKLYLQIEFCAKSSFYISNALNIYYLNSAYRLPAGSFDVGDSRRIFISSCVQFYTYDRTLSYNRDGGGSYIDTTLATKGAITPSENLAENTLFPLSSALAPNIVYDGNSQGVLYPKLGQSKVYGIDSSEEPLFCVDIDLNKVMIEEYIPDAENTGIPTYNLSDFINHRSGANCYAEFYFNGISNNSSLTFLNNQFAFSSAGNSLDFSLEMINSNIIRLKYFGVNAADKVLFEQVNRIGFVYYIKDKNGVLVKSYFEEYLFSKTKRDVLPLNGTASFVETDIFNNGINVHIPFETSGVGTSSNITDADFNTSLGAKYELVLVNNDFEHVLTDRASDLITGNYALDYNLNLWNFLGVNAYKGLPDGYDLSTPFTVILRRRHYSTVRDVFTSLPFSAVKLKTSDFVLTTHKLDKQKADVPLGVKGYVALGLSETSSLTNLTNILPYILDIRISVTGSNKNISLKSVTQSSGYDLTPLSALINNTFEEYLGSCLLFEIPYVTDGAIIPTNIQTLQFNNEGLVNGTVSAVIELRNGETFEINSNYTIGEETPLNPSVFSNNNALNLRNNLDPNSNSLVFYDNNAEFNIDSVDSLSEEYTIYQNSNEDYSFKTLSSSRNFSYKVPFENIDYTKSKSQNTPSLKFITKRKTKATDGSVKETISNETEISCIFRKRTAFPVVNESSSLKNKIVIDDNCSILNELKQEITFNDLNGMFSSSLTQILEGSFINSTGINPLVFMVSITLKDNPTVSLNAYAHAKFTIDDPKMMTYVNGGEPYVVDFGGIDAPIYHNGVKVDKSLINSITFKGTQLTSLTIKDLFEKYFQLYKSSVTAGNYKIYLSLKASDSTLTPSNISRLLSLKDEKGNNVYTNDSIQKLKEKIESNTTIKFFDVVKNGVSGLFVSPLKGLMKHVNPEVVKEETIDTYYTYADEVSFDVFSHNATKIEYRINNASNFTELLLNKNDAISTIKASVSSSLKVTTPKSSTQVVYVRQYDAAGKVDFEKSFKVIRMDLSIIFPKVVYGLIQDNELNYKNYGKKELVFDVGRISEAESILVEIKDLSQNTLMTKTLTNINESEIVSLPVPIYDKTYLLEVTPYDFSGRPTKTYGFKALYVSQNIEPVVNVENSSNMLNGKYIVNGDSILLAFEDYSSKNVIGYKVSINNLYELYFKQSVLGFNYLNISHLAGKEITSGSYSINVIPVNLLGTESEKSGSVIVDFAKYPRPIKCNVTSFNDVVRDINCLVSDYDKDTTEKFVYFVKYTDKEGVLSEKKFESKNTSLTFEDGEFKLSEVMKSNTNFTLSVYPANFNGFYSEANKAVIKLKYFNEEVVVDYDYVKFLPFTKDKNLIVLFKPHPYVLKTECKLNLSGSSYSVVEDNMFVSPNAFNLNSTYDLSIRYTDISGNTFEVQRNVAYDPVGDSSYLNAINDETFINLGDTGPVFYPSFNLDFKDFGHNQLLFVNRSTGREYLIGTLEQVSKTPVDFGELSSGNYVFDVYAYSDKKKNYSKFLKSFIVYYLKENPTTPKIINTSSLTNGKKTAYTNSREFILNWSSPSNIKLLDDETGIKIESFVLKNGAYAPFGEIIELNKTELTSKFNLNIAGNSQFKFLLSVLGKNGLYSIPDELIVIQLLKQPNPVVFDLNPIVNPKYVKKSDNNAYEFFFSDSANTETYEKLTKVEIFLNNGTSLGVFDLNGTNPAVVPTENPYEYRAVVVLTDDINTVDLFIIGFDNAGNKSTDNLSNVKLMSSQAFGTTSKQYAYFTKVIDSVNPVNLNEKTVIIRKNASVLNTVSGVSSEYHNAIDVMFDLPDAELTFLKFELLVSTTDSNDVVLCSGSTFSKQENLKGIVLNSGIIPDDFGTDSFKILPRDENILFSNSFENIKLQFINLHTGQTNKLRLSSVDLSGNCSDWYEIPIEISDLTTIAPYFVKPTSNYVNNETLQFEWDFNSDLKVLSWEYQFKKEGELKGQTDAHWSSNGTNKTFKKRVFADKGKTTEYTLYVRGVFGYDSSGNKLCTKENFRTIVLDTIAPGSIIFTNLSFTNDPSVLKWEWKPSNPNDNIDGYLVSFDQTLSLDKWEKNTSGAKVSLGQRDDGAFTLYVIPYDNAGNIYIGEPFFSTIILDTNPPTKIEFDNSDVINTNKIPTISWLKNYNLRYVRWLVLPETLALEFVKLYEEIVFNNVDDYKYIWDVSFNNAVNVSPLVLQFINNPLFKDAIQKNIPVNNSIENSIYLNNSAVDYKNGIKEENEGSYFAIFVGEEYSGLYTSELNYKKIVYDKTLPDLKKIELLSYKNVYVESLLSLENLESIHSVFNIRKPKFVVKTGTDVDSVEFKILNSSTNKEYTSSLSKTYSSVTDVNNENFRLFSYEQPFNLSESDYILSVNLNDNAGNYRNLVKVFTIIDNDSLKLIDTFDLFIEEINCYATISQIRNTNSFKIISINLNKNSSLHYREISDSGFENKFSIYNICSTELDINKTYEFKVLGYNINENI